MTSTFMVHRAADVVRYFSHRYINSMNIEYCEQKKKKKKIKNVEMLLFMPSSHCSRFDFRYTSVTEVRYGYRYVH